MLPRPRGAPAPTQYNRQPRQGSSGQGPREAAQHTSVCVASAVMGEPEASSLTACLHHELQQSPELSVAVAVIRTLTRAIKSSAATTMMGSEKVSAAEVDARDYC